MNGEGVAVFRRPRSPLPKHSLRLPHGKPLRCPKCPPKHYYGKLKLPGEKDTPCENCGTQLVAAANRRKGGSGAA